jgi:hypothetical protein
VRTLSTSAVPTCDLPTGLLRMRRTAEEAGWTCTVLFGNGVRGKRPVASVSLRMRRGPVAAYGLWTADAEGRATWLQGGHAGRVGVGARELLALLSGDG